ncbi:MAG: hypothetical protein EPO41_03935 [Reyranella sp.]|uniref:virion core protein, T7 gp14 family n=1 Tax=Reyranella sp. TaxID=1929291 RepID=UPI00122B2A78|nr:hypothetical protein [Reyranella sp.]TAJ97151.1 MAG: hypothetical protein EPO41_03935 [Reyranella sp.]
MCVEPTTAMAGASLAIGTAQAVSKYAAGQEDAASQRAYQAQAKYNAEVARNQTYDQIGMRQQQEIDAASQALFDNSIRAIKARATADAGAADAGVQGNSVESVARNVYMEQGRIDSATERNTKMSVQQLQEEKKQADAQYRSRTNLPEVRGPSALGLGLEIAGAGLSAYDLYDRPNRINGGGGTGKKNS